jgi:ERCC4-type nuclease
MNQDTKKIPIIIDTHEQIPFLWNGYDGVSIYHDTLKAGDYTLVGHDMPKDDDSIIIERKKSCQELCSNLVTYWDRFERELEMLSQYKHKFIVVADNNNFESIYNKGYTKVHPNFIYKKLSLIYLSYGVNTLFLGSHKESEQFLYRLFKEIINGTE